jgi:hypothetical protein
MLSGDAVSLRSGSGIPSFVSASAGEAVRVAFTPFALSGVDSACYYLPDPSPKDAAGRIAPALLTITPSGGQRKAYGEVDKPLAFTVSGWQGEDASDSAKIIRGALSRAAGSGVGKYEITQGSLSAGSSYTLHVTPGVMFEIIFASSDVLMVTSINDDAGNDLGGRWEREEVDSETVLLRYRIPCDKNAVSQLNITYTTSQGDAQNLKFDVSAPGRQVATVEIPGEGKRYQLEVVKNFELFDIINEHMGSLRVVNNNPALNKSGMVFEKCVWEVKKDGKWAIVETKSLYYAAGQSISDKFSSADSMRLTLQTTSGDIQETCPDDGSGAGSGSNDGASSSNNSSKSAALSVYPNPVAAGGTIKLKQAELADGEDEPYADFYLFDAQGRLTLAGSFSALRGGLTMPVAPGIYHLVLEGKAGRKVLKVAVE